MKVVVIQASEYEALYINDELIMQDDEITVLDVANETQSEEITLEVIHANRQMETFLMSHDGFPEDLNELPL